MTNYPSNFIGPLRPGDTRSPAPTINQVIPKSPTPIQALVPKGGTVTTNRGSYSYAPSGGGGGGGGTSSAPTINQVSSQVGPLTSSGNFYSSEDKKKTNNLGFGTIDFGNLNLGVVPSKTITSNRETIQNINPSKETNNILLGEYLGKGYTPYEAKVLTNTAGFSGLNYSKEQADKTIIKYSKEHVPSSIFSLFSGEMETNKQYQDNVARQNNAWGQNITYRELQNKGDYPTIVRKGFTDVFTKYFGGVSDIVAKRTNSTKLSEERKRQGGRILGETALWSFFSPTMSTGSYGDEFEEFGKSMKKKNTQQLSSNRFTDLGTGLDITVKENAIGKIEKDLLNLKTLAEQKTYLANLYKTTVKNSEQEAGFKILLNELNAKNIIKNPVIDVGKGGTIITPTSQATTRFYYDPAQVFEDIPKMKGLGSMTGFVTQDYTSTKNKKNIEPQVTDYPKQNSFMDSMLGNIISSTVKNKEKNKQRYNNETASISKLIIGDFIIQSPRQIPKQIPKYGYPEPYSPKYPRYKMPIPFMLPRIKPPKSAWGWNYRTYTTKTKGSKRAYAPSLAAFQLNIFAKKGYKPNKSYSGLEIRPQFYEQKDYQKNYNKKLNKLLIGGF